MLGVDSHVSSEPGVHDLPGGGGKVGLFRLPHCKREQLWAHGEKDFTAQTVEVAPAVITPRSVSCCEGLCR